MGGPSSTTTEGSPQGKVNTGELLLQWIDHYEEAVTNHYSPELRARIPSVRPNGLSAELLSLSSVDPAYRLASKAGGFKVNSDIMLDFFILISNRPAKIISEEQIQIYFCYFRRRWWRRLPSKLANR